jgi:hypothetical protein
MKGKHVMKDVIKAYFSLCKTCPVKCPLPGPPDKPDCKLREQEEQRIKEKLLREFDRLDRTYEVKG